MYFFPLYMRAELQGCLPVNPSEQKQTHASILSLHTPPFRHGLDLHSSTLLSQWVPV